MQIDINQIKNNLTNKESIHKKWVKEYHLNRLQAESGIENIFEYTQQLKLKRQNKLRESVINFVTKLDFTYETDGGFLIIKKGDITFILGLTAKKFRRVGSNNWIPFTQATFKKTIKKN